MTGDHSDAITRTTEPPPPLLIRSGRVIDPASGRDETADVAIADGRVVEIGPGLATPMGTRVIEAEGLLVCPGFIDPHVHLREPGQTHKETIATGTAAAVAGGFTTVCCMPNTSPALDSAEWIRWIFDRAASEGACRVFPVCAATVGRKGEALAPIAACARAGAVAVSDDGDAVASAAMMHAALLAAVEADLVFMQHCQEVTLTQGSVMHAGDVSARLGLIGWPAVAEELTLERDIRLTALTGARYHAQHMSSAGSVELIRAARARGLAVSGEASPHHLTLTDEACDGFNTAAKMNPPLRTEADRRALVEGVADGTITILATDHAPHAADEKAQPFEDAPFGIVGLETAVPLYAEALVASGAIDWPRLIALLTIEPARLCGLDRRGLGSLAVGGPADVTIYDPAATWTVGPDTLAGRSVNTPFMGRALTGRPTATIVGGAVRMDRASEPMSAFVKPV